MQKRPTWFRRALGVGLATTALAAAPARADLPAPSIVANSGSYLAGRSALARADADRAADYLLRARTDDPDDIEPNQQAFAASLMAGRPETASLARVLPENAVARLFLAGEDARAGNWEGAEQRFRNLPRLSAGAEQTGLTELLQPLLIAWSQAGGARYDAAQATLRPLLESSQFRAIYGLHAALIADVAGRIPEARRLYRMAEADYAEPNLRLAEILASWEARQGRVDDAARTLRALGRSASEMAIALPALQAAAASRARPITRATDGIAETYLALAAALRAQDKPEFSLLLLRLALSLRPDFSAARLLLAEMHEASRHDTAAIAALAPIEPPDPLVGVARLHRASIESRLGQTDNAVRALDRIAADYPRSPLPLAQLGDLWREKSKFADAIAAYDRAIARLPPSASSGAPTTAAPAATDREFWPLFYSRGIAEERAGQWPRAQADFERALRLAPDQPSVLNYLGYSWADRGIRLTQARDMLERAVRARPNDGAIVDSLGWVLLRQGDPHGAIRALEHAAELESEDSSINGHLGDAYAAVGRAREAVFQWRRALTLDPEPGDAEKLKRKLAVADPTPQSAADKQTNDKPTNDKRTDNAVPNTAASSTR